MLTKNNFKYASWIEARVDGFRSDFINNDISFVPVMKHNEYLGRGNAVLKQNIERFIKSGGTYENVLQIKTKQPRSIYPDEWQGFVVKAYDKVDVDLDLFPTCKQAIDMFGDECMNLVYARLQPNTDIPIHIDMENINGDLVAVHLPIIMEKDSSFLKYEQESIPLSVGEIAVLQTELLHSSHNKSNTMDRINVIFVFRKDKVII